MSHLKSFTATIFQAKWFEAKWFHVPGLDITRNLIPAEKLDSFLSLKKKRLFSVNAILRVL